MSAARQTSHAPTTLPHLSRPRRLWRSVRSLRPHLRRLDLHVRQFLDLTTAHLPPELGQSLGSVSGVDAYELRCDHWSGWWMWVPPKEAIDEAEDAIPEAIVAIWRHAQDLGCDYVLFDPDAEPAPALATWDW
jgi:hypothetical protein